MTCPLLGAAGAACPARAVDNLPYYHRGGRVLLDVRLRAIRNRNQVCNNNKVDNKSLM